MEKSLPKDAVDAASLLVFNRRAAHKGEAHQGHPNTHMVASTPCSWPLLAPGLVATHGSAWPSSISVNRALPRPCLQSCASRTLLAITCPATMQASY